MKRAPLKTMVFALVAGSLLLAGCGDSGANKEESGSEAAMSAAQSEKAAEVAIEVGAIEKAMEANGLECVEEVVDVKDVTTALACGSGETQLLVRQFTKPDLAREYAREDLTVRACAEREVSEFHWIMGDGSWIIYSENAEQSELDLLDNLREELNFEAHKEVC